MIAGLLLMLGVSAGFGLPFMALGLGGALALGSVITLLALFSATVFAGLAVSTAGWLVMGLAAACAIAGMRRPAWQPGWACHPVLALPLLVVATALAAGVPTYLPVNWDEMSGWASWVRQIMATDTWWRADMESSYPEYTKAWPILAAFVNRLATGDQLGAGIGALAALHAMALGAFYDLAVRLFSRLGGVTPNVSRGMAWNVLLILLAGEASWKLVPHSYLIEHPQLYPAIAFLCFAALAISRPGGGIAWWAAGLALAAAYATKTPMAALSAPALVFAVMAKGRRWQTACALFLPLAVVIAGWAMARPPVPPRPLDFDPSLMGEVLSKLALQFPAYLFSWKLPLTAVGVVGLAAALWPGKGRTPELRGLAAGLAAFALAVWIGLIPLYLFVIHLGGEEDLPSLPRYMGVPLRLIHLFGPLLAVAVAASYAGRVRVVRRLTESRAALPVLAAAAIALAGLQSVMVSRQIAAMADHPDFGREAMTEVRRVVTAMPAIDRAVALSGEARPRLLVLDQGTSGFAAVIVHHYSIRAPGTPSAHVHRFELMGNWSFGPTQANTWMRSTNGAQFRKTIGDARIVWVSRLDTWSANELEPLIGTCPGGIANRVLLRNEDHAFDCVE